MLIFPPEPEITLYETGFDNDALGREKSGKSLSALLDRIEDPLVVALDGRWGTGKLISLKDGSVHTANKMTEKRCPCILMHLQMITCPIRWLR